MSSQEICIVSLDTFFHLHMALSRVLSQRIEVFVITHTQSMTPCPTLPANGTALDNDCMLFCSARCSTATTTHLARMTGLWGAYATWTSCFRNVDAVMPNPTIEGRHGQYMRVRVHGNWGLNDLMDSMAERDGIKNEERRDKRVA